ncbi:hypothetical protein IWQ60_008973 [Tieghemiomyces parasiticus]|uniref:Uncharacterized protein n=1 Tax=Tieghemiomyces parasiticus TaxID=78921 RepID=A0A9W7ZVJ0_9FUNG|nr:hypothetical protein IWQ60_008973 [Tieghemiomyces parasiticus]
MAPHDVPDWTPKQSGDMQRQLTPYTAPSGAGGTHSEDLPPILSLADRSPALLGKLPGTKRPAATFNTAAGPTGVSSPYKRPRTTRTATKGDFTPTRLSLGLSPMPLSSVSASQQPSVRTSRAGSPGWSLVSNSPTGMRTPTTQSPRLYSTPPVRHVVYPWTTGRAPRFDIQKARDRFPAQDFAAWAKGLREQATQVMLPAKRRLPSPSKLSSSTPASVTSSRRPEPAPFQPVPTAPAQPTTPSPAGTRSPTATLPSIQPVDTATSVSTSPSPPRLTAPAADDVNCLDSDSEQDGSSYEEDEYVEYHGSDRQEFEGESEAELRDNRHRSVEPVATEMPHEGFSDGDYSSPRPHDDDREPESGDEAASLHSYDYVSQDGDEPSSERPMPHDDPTAGLPWQPPHPEFRTDEESARATDIEVISLASSDTEDGKDVSSPLYSDRTESDRGRDDISTSDHSDTDDRGAGHLLASLITTSTQEDLERSPSEGSDVTDEEGPDSSSDREMEGSPPRSHRHSSGSSSDARAYLLDPLNSSVATDVVVEYAAASFFDTDPLPLEAGSVSPASSKGPLASSEGNAQKAGHSETGEEIGGSRSYDGNGSEVGLDRIDRSVSPVSPTDEPAQTTAGIIARTTRPTSPSWVPPTPTGFGWGWGSTATDSWAKEVSTFYDTPIAHRPSDTGDHGEATDAAGVVGPVSADASMSPLVDDKPPVAPASVKSPSMSHSSSIHRPGVNIPVLTVESAQGSEPVPAESLTTPRALRSRRNSIESLASTSSQLSCQCAWSPGHQPSPHTTSPYFLRSRCPSKHCVRRSDASPGTAGPTGELVPLASPRSPAQVEVSESLFESPSNNLALRRRRRSVGPETLLPDNAVVSGVPTAASAVEGSPNAEATPVVPFPSLASTALPRGKRSADPLPSAQSAARPHPRRHRASLADPSDRPALPHPRRRRTLDSVIPSPATDSSQLTPLSPPITYTLRNRQVPATPSPSNRPPPQSSQNKADGTPERPPRSKRKLSFDEPPMPTQSDTDEADTIASRLRKRPAP